MPSKYTKYGKINQKESIYQLFIQQNRRKMNVPRQRQEKKEKELCGICLARKITARIDCCDHQFCSTCIKDWSKVFVPQPKGDLKTCPLCRRDINLINSIKTGKLLYRVRRQLERAPEIIVVNQEADQAEVMDAVVLASERLERERQQERERQRLRERQQQRLPPHELERLQALHIHRDRQRQREWEIQQERERQENMERLLQRNSQLQRVMRLQEQQRMRNEIPAMVRHMPVKKSKFNLWKLFQVFLIILGFYFLWNCFF